MVPRRDRGENRCVELVGEIASGGTSEVGIEGAHRDLRHDHGARPKVGADAIELAPIFVGDYQRVEIFGEVEQACDSAAVEGVVIGEDELV